MSEREETPTERVAHLGRIATLDPGRYVVRLVVDDGHGGKEYERLDRWQQRALVEACAQYDRVQLHRARVATGVDLAEATVGGQAEDRTKEAKWPNEAPHGDGAGGRADGPTGANKTPCTCNILGRNRRCPRHGDNVVTQTRSGRPTEGS